MKRDWKTTETRPAGDFSIFTLRLDRSVSPETGFEKEWTVLESNDWVNVVPVTPEGEIVLIRQYRHGTGAYTIEIPGGGIDRADRDGAEAAGRELGEETGYEAERLVHIGTVEPNPAFQTNRCFTYLAENAVLRGPQRLDPGEEIEVFRVREAEVWRMIREGEIAHALVVAAFYWYAVRAGGPEGSDPFAFETL
ncbi:MAG: NUDIX hydrolase [Candidatus Eisenbacteria bacterium]